MIHNKFYDTVCEVILDLLMVYMIEKYTRQPFCSTLTLVKTFYPQNTASLYIFVETWQA